MDESLILENMEMVAKIGMKYAIAHNRYPDEAIAEAYYHLTLFFTEDKKLYLARPHDYKGTLGIYVKRAISKYFERNSRIMDSLTTDKIIRNTDEEMIEFLSGLMTDEQAFTVFDYLRNGINLFEVDMVDPLLRKVVKKLRILVTARIRRVEQLQKAGIKTSREINYDRSLEDEPEESQETDCAA